MKMTPSDILELCDAALKKRTFLICGLAKTQFGGEAGI
jgi:hypothetical protein